MSVTQPNESEAYRQARQDLLEAEMALRAQSEAVAALRRALPPGGIVPEDYVFAGLDGTKRALSELFGDHQSLAVYSLMFGPDDLAPCSMCASMLDGLDDQVPHISQRMAVAVVCSASPRRLSEVARARNWRRLPLFSAAETGYQRTYRGEAEDGSQLPMMNVFERVDGEVRHFWGSEMFFADVDGQPRHVDSLWPLWNLFDMTRQGRGSDWYPALGYE